MNNQSETDINQNNSADSDNSELDTCKKQAEEYLNNWKRERADFVNYKKDETKRAEEFIKFANEGLVLELLDIIEESMVARAQMPKEIQEKHPEWVDGIDKIREKGFEFLRRNDVERIKTVGEKFDPLLHESVEEVTSDGAEAGKVVEEVKPGFTLYGRVIKPAQVKITS